MEMAHCLLKSMRVPAQFWGEAVKVAVYLLNRSPTKSLNGKNPFEAWFGKKPGVKHLHTFGCVAYAKRVGPGVSKLADRSVPGVFFGYEPGTKGFCVYDLVKGKLMVTRDVIFDEKKAWNWEGNDSRLSNDAAVPDTFTVQCFDTVPGPTIGPGADSEGSAASEFDGGEPVSPTASIPSVGGASNTPPHTPSPSPGTPGPMIQWATPPTNASQDSDCAPL